MTDIESNFRRFGTHHTACGRVLKRPHTAGLEDDAMDNPPPGIEPVRHVIQGAQAYARAKGLADPHQGIDYHSVRTNRNLLTDLAHHYDHLPLNDPGAHRHFAAMRNEVNSQYHFMTNRMGIKVHVVDHDPYKDVHELRNDVDKNRQIKVLGTHITGSHPFFTDEENDRFRAVHDVFGHLSTGRDFDRHGEEAAFQAHARMFTHHALPAMTSETRGQNGSLIVNGHFGPQRIAVLPQHLWHPGLAHTGGMIDDFRIDQEAQNRRAERETGGYTTEMKSYFGYDNEGNEREHRLTLKDYLRHRTQPKESDYENESWSMGNQLGLRHSTEEDRGHHVDEFNDAADTAYSPEHFVRGYMRGMERSGMNYRVAVMEGSGEFRVLGHVSGNSINILHCPFCGSGAVIGRSDGTIECGYCTTVFTVQVQPAYNGFPQSVDGQPYPWPGAPDPGDVLAPQAPPGTNLAPGGQPPLGMPDGPPDSSDPADGGDFGDDESDDDDKPDFLKGKSDKKDDSDKDDKKKDTNPFAKKSYIARNGAELLVDEFLAHLAITTATDPNRAAQKVREARKRGEL